MRYLESSTKCLSCSQDIADPRRRFCNKTCSDRHYRSLLVPFTCIACGEEATVQRWIAASRKYCSRACYRAHFNTTFLSGGFNGRWRGGRALPYGPGWKKAKELARARDVVCLDCGKTKEENKRALDVHHTEPFRFSGVHDLDKLRSLCRSCHMKADDHGRRGCARFLLQAGIIKPPTKRSIRKRRAKRRRLKREAARRSKQKRAERLSAGGASLREIARELGVSHQTVANWLNGLYQAPFVPEQLTLRLSGWEPSAA